MLRSDPAEIAALYGYQSVGDGREIVPGSRIYEFALPRIAKRSTHAHRDADHEALERHADVHSVEQQIMFKSVVKGVVTFRDPL